MRITPMLLASLADVPTTVARYGSVGPAEPLTLPVYSYLVETDDGGLVVFDLGPYSPDEAAASGRRLVGERRSPARAVQDLGHDPAAVRAVVLSHLHWDHCVGIGDFPDARILVQREELRYAFAPDPEQWHPYDSWELGRRAPWLEHLQRIEPVDGPGTVAPGVILVPTPGHTPGSQSLLVQGARPYLLCGDLLNTYENWLGIDRPGGRRTSRFPPGIHADLARWRASVDLIDRGGWVPLPAHESRVVDVLDGAWDPGSDL